MVEASTIITWVGTIEGLDCADCAATLAKAFEKIKGVKSASLNFATSKLMIQYDPQVFDESGIKKVKGVFVALAIPGMASLWMAVGADMGASILVILNGLTLLATKES